MRKTGAARARPSLGRFLLLALLGAAAVASAFPESATAKGGRGKRAALAKRLVVVESPADRSSVHSDAAGNVEVLLRLADDADLSTFSASIGKTNCSSEFTLDPVSRIGVATLALSAGATYSLKVSVDAVAAPSGRAGSRGRRRHTDKVRFTVVEDAPDDPAGGLAAAAANLPPVAAFTYALTGLTVDVDGSGSSDPDGVIVDYSWDFGDGGMDSGSLASHPYAQAGTFTVTLTVTDDGGAMDSVASVVTPREPNGAPTASFTYLASGLSIDVDASDSSDPDGPVVDYAWDYGDGMLGTGQTASHTYALAGTYTVTLTVEDYPGATDNDSQDITVALAPGVVFTFNPLPNYHVNEGSTLTFTVTATSGGSPLTVTASGLPSMASFDGTNFSWPDAQFEGNGRHDMTFSAGGESAPAVAATTQYPLVDPFLLYSEPNVPLVGDIKIPVGGQESVLAGGLFDTPFGISPIAGRGTNSWAAFLWSIADTSIASFVSVTNVALFQGEMAG